MSTKDASLYRPEGELPIEWRIRGLEQRPLVGDPEAYVSHLEKVGFTVSTIGAMNGLGFAGYPTTRLPVVDGMDSRWIPGVLEEAHRKGISLICWNVYNVQDVRAVDDFQIAKRYPEWTMKYIEESEAEYGPRVGMCVLSSPYLAEHVKLLQEIVKFGPDAMWFDGFYLGGIPHPIRPGCVCEYCRRRFKSDYDLPLPERVDWSDPTFKRWVRWRNERLVGGARFVAEKLREERADLPVTFNYNHWPFGSKDWANAIPLWSTRDYGVSQHAYTPDERLQWVMLGYKAQLSHDLNPAYSDIWRTGRPIFEMDDSAQAQGKHELQIRLFTLAALSAGTIPWRSSHQYSDIQRRNNNELRAREHTFAKDKIARVGVVISQNSHDFWGHIPGTDNKTAYRNAVLGTWLLLTEHHIPFVFLFDNDLEADDAPNGALKDLSALILPSTACISERQAESIGAWAASGGTLFAGGPAGTRDEWGQPLPEARDFGPSVRLFSDDPGAAYARDRSSQPARDLIASLRAMDQPITIDGPMSLACSVFRRDVNTVVVHLMNASAFYRWENGCGFAGLAAESDSGATTKDTGSDAETGTRGPTSPTFETIPAENVVVQLDAALAASADSAEATVLGRSLRVEGGKIIVPTVGDHEALIITTA